MQADSIATSSSTSSSGALGDTHPFTTKKGSSMDMASRPPGRLPPAQHTGRPRPRILPPTPLPQPPAPGAGVTQSSGRAQARVHGAAAGPAFDGTADRIPDLEPAPAAASSPGSSRAGPACLTPPPGRKARTNHRRGLLHHFRTRAHVIRGYPPLSRRGLGTRHRTWRPGFGGEGGGRVFSLPTSQDSRERAAGLS